MGNLIPEGGIELNDALEVAKEFLNPYPSLENIDVKFNNIAVNVTHEAKVSDLQKAYENKYNALREAKNIKETN